MIIQLKFKYPEKYTIQWIGWSMIGFKRKVKVKSIYTKVFDTYIEAEGFAEGMIKRGVKVTNFIKGEL